MDEFIDEQGNLTPSLELSDTFSDDSYVQLFIARETLLVSLEQMRDAML
jgi:hypothetical protein